MKHTTTLLTLIGCPLLCDCDGDTDILSVAEDSTTAAVSDSFAENTSDTTKQTYSTTITTTAVTMEHQ